MNYPERILNITYDYFEYKEHENESTILEKIYKTFANDVKITEIFEIGSDITVFSKEQYKLIYRNNFIENQKYKDMELNYNHILSQYHNFEITKSTLLLKEQEILDLNNIIKQKDPITTISEEVTTEVKEEKKQKAKKPRKKKADK